MNPAWLPSRRKTKIISSVSPNTTTPIDIKIELNRPDVSKGEMITIIHGSSKVENYWARKLLENDWRAYLKLRLKTIEQTDKKECILVENRFMIMGKLYRFIFYFIFFIYFILSFILPVKTANIWTHNLKPIW